MLSQWTLQIIVGLYRLDIKSRLGLGPKLLFLWISYFFKPVVFFDANEGNERLFEEVLFHKFTFESN